MHQLAELRSECFACGKPSARLCLRCGGSLCAEHMMAAYDRCSFCVWFGYYRRWLLREVLLWTGVLLLAALASVLLFRGGWLMYAVFIPIGLLLRDWRPLRSLDGYKRTLFLADRRPELWYQYAIKLKGSTPARARSR
jgi:hypothetical protein